MAANRKYLLSLRISIGFGVSATLRLQCLWHTVLFARCMTAPAADGSNPCSVDVATDYQPFTEVSILPGSFHQFVNRLDLAAGLSPFRHKPVKSEMSKKLYIKTHGCQMNG